MRFSLLRLGVLTLVISNLFIACKPQIEEEEVKGNSDVPREVYVEESKQLTLKHEGIDREFIVYYPPLARKKDKAPVVFMFHGTTGNGLKFWKISQWKEKAREEGFIAVFPSSLKYCYWHERDQKFKNHTKWNYGTLQDILCDGEVAADDFGFFRKMVKYVTTKLNGDKKRIYVSGFSNGAGFTTSLAVVAADLIAAGSAAAGGVKFDFNEVDRPETKIPFYAFLGNLDGKIVEFLGEPMPADETFLEHEFITEYKLYPYLDQFEMDPEVYDLRVNETGASARYTRSLVGADNVFIYRMIKGLEHQYPNGTNHPLVAADFLWRFMSKYSK